MPKTKISEYSTTNSANTDIESINIDEGCAPSGINNAIRELMVHLKEFQTGSSGDPLTVAGTFVASGGATLSGTNTLSGSTVMTASAGTSASPSIHFSSDTNTGIFSPAADTIAFAEGGVEAARFDSSGNLRVGTTSSLSVADKLTVVGGNFAVQRSSGITTFMGDNTTDGYAGTATNHAFALLTNSVERARIDTSGNVGIGTSSPIRPLQVGAYGTGNGEIALASSTTGFGSVLFGDGGTGTDIYRGYVQYSHTSDAMIFATAAIERMRIDSSGNLLVGTTSTATPTQGFVFDRSTDSLMRIGHTTGTVSGSNYVIFGFNAGVIGSISQSGTTAVLYNTSSDYRLKENIAPMTGALAKVAQLSPVTYNWKADGSAGQGFIAHELQAVVPDAVTGEKDGEEMQGVDYGKITPLLTAALQEAIAEIQSLKARIAVLEAK
jgi:hypothetical protein